MSSHGHKRIHGLLIVTACLPCFVRVRMSPATSPQSGAKDKSYCTVNNITLNSNFEAQRDS
jgi:hypothetical protein